MVYQGYCDPRFAEVQTLLQGFVASEEELGASITVNVAGENVVDIWAGFTDPSRTKPWEKDTIVNTFSSIKTVASLAVLMLVDRGLLDIDENVSKYWPEFAANGKEDVKVRHVLSHTSGVSGWEEVVSTTDLYDYGRMSSLLAAQAPWWEPGTASGYHAMNLGYLYGELVRRTTGKTLKQFVAEEIATPLGADIQIGALEKDWPRIANIVSVPGVGDFGQLDPNSIAMKTLANPALVPETVWTAAWRNADIGAVNGHGNARSLARVLSAITLDGEVDGTRLLSQKTIDLIFQEQSNGVDLVLGIPIVFGNGYAITGPNPAFDWLPKGKVCFWGGWGGSLAIMDLERRVTISYTMNKMGAGLIGNDRAPEYIKAIYAALESEAS